MQKTHKSGSSLGKGKKRKIRRGDRVGQGDSGTDPDDKERKEQNSIFIIIPIKKSANELSTVVCIIGQSCLFGIQ
jgi:hypothetical protein